jgi:hypothetical protein
MITLGILAASGAALLGQSVGVSMFTGGTPFIHAYEWLPGYGIKYANPASPPSLEMNAVAFTEKIQAIGAVGFGGDRQFVYEWLPGFGTRYSGGPSLPGTGNALSWTPTDSHVFFGHVSGSHVTTINWSTSGFGSSVTAPSHGLSTLSGVRTSNPADYAGVVGATAPRVKVFTWLPAWGTAFSDPSVAIPNTGRDIDFSSTLNDVAIAHNASATVPADGGLSVYPFSTGGFGTRYALPATKPLGVNWATRFANNGTNILVAHESSPFISAYPFTSGTGLGTKYSNPAGTTGSTGRGLSLSRKDEDVTLATNGTPHTQSWVWTGSGFGTKYANPVTGLPSAAATDTNFS